MEMDMEFLRKLPTPKELKEQFPVSEKIAAIKEDRDKQIREIFEGKDDRLLLIIGPCSADNEDAVIDYISRLRTVQDKVADKIFALQRVAVRICLLSYLLTADSSTLFCNLIMKSVTDRSF